MTAACVKKGCRAIDLSSDGRRARFANLSHSGQASFTMGFLKAIVSLVLFAIIAVAAYWLIASYTTKGELPYWAEINANLPEPLRSFACENIKKTDATAVVASCQ
jgi:hypothetical protein